MLGGYQDIRSRNCAELIRDHGLFDAAHGMQYESLNYDEVDSEVNEETRKKLTLSSRLYRKTIKVAISALIGVIIGILAWGVHQSVSICAKYRAIFLGDLYEDSGKNFFWPLVVHLGLSAILFIIAASLVAFVEPVARSSGVAEVKSYLNGVNVPHVFRMRTFAIKVFALILSLVGGILGGKEGPMVLIGAMVGASIPQGKSSTLGVDFRALKHYRSDTQKRQFVSIGASTGLTCAFGAPIGGVMWGIEEGSSWWSGPLTALTFFSGIVGILVVNVLTVGLENKWGNLSSQGLIGYAHDRLRPVPFTLLHFPIFVAIGIIGGVLGGVFNLLYRETERVRSRFFRRSPYFLVVEAVLCGLLTVFVTYSLPYFHRSLSQCVDISSVKAQLTASSIPIINLYCPQPSTQMNLLASAFFQVQESTVRVLNSDIVEWTYSSLIVIFFVYFFLCIWSFGIALPNGIFAPTLVIGSCYGRIVAMLVQNYLGLTVDVSAFTVIGSASMMGGVTRLTVALAVLLTEAVDNTSYMLPVVCACLVAKFIGDRISRSIYEIQIDARSIPYLDFEPTPEALGLRADEICAKPVVCFNFIERVGAVYGALERRKHNCFPILDGNGKLVGVILRYQVIVLLKSRAWATLAEAEAGKVKHVDLEAFLKPYPRYPDVSSVSVSLTERDMFMDIRPYMAYPLSVLSDCPLSRCYRLFRVMGLRQLVVIDEKNKVSGIITRKNLAPHFLKTKLHSLRRMHVEEEARIYSAVSEQPLLADYGNRIEDDFENDDFPDSPLPTPK